MAKIAYGYVRVSTDQQGETGLDSQRQVITDLWEQHLKKDYPELQIFADEDKSAREYEFLERPRAKEISLRVTPEDCIIFPKLDRAFRNLRDTLNMMHHWDKLGIRIVCRDFQFGGIPFYDSKNPLCRLGMIMAAWFAEVESDRVSQRMHDFNAMCRRQGRSSGSVPFGFIQVRRGEPQGYKRRPPAYLQPNDDEQQILEFIRVHKLQGIGYLRIFDHFRKAGIMDPRTGKPFSQRTRIVEIFKNWRKIKAAEANLQEQRGYPLQPWEFITPHLALCERFDKLHLKPGYDASKTPAPEVSNERPPPDLQRLSGSDLDDDES